MPRVYKGVAKSQGETFILWAIQVYIHGIPKMSKIDLYIFILSIMAVFIVSLYSSGGASCEPENFRIIAGTKIYISPCINTIVDL